MSGENNNTKGIIDQEINGLNKGDNASTASTSNAESEADQEKERLLQEVAFLQKNLQEKDDAYLRLFAEVDNIKKRTDREKREASKFALESFCAELIPFCDSFNQAILTHTSSEDDSFQKGMSLVFKSFLEILAKNGISEINPLVGDKFDPNLHQAIQSVFDEEKKDGSIHSLFVKGYSLQGRVLRPAMVSVTTHNSKL